MKAKERKRLLKQLKTHWDRRLPLGHCFNNVKEEGNFKHLQTELYTLLKEAVVEYEGFSGNSIGNKNLIACEGGLEYEEEHPAPKESANNKDFKEILADLKALDNSLEESYEIDMQQR